MATIKLGIDKYHPDKSGNVAVRIEFSSKGKMAPFALNVMINAENWDKKNQIIKQSEPRFKTKNSIIESKFEQYNSRFEELYKKGNLPSDAIKIRDLIVAEKSETSFLEYFQKVIETKNNKTKEIYELTLSKIKLYSNKKNICFDDINSEWLHKFTSFLKSKGNKTNTISIHLRNIRKVFNDAIDSDIISIEKYPFRRGFKIQKEETAHRDIPIQDFKKIIKYNGTKVENWARDIFLLSFYLIGINMKDLYYVNDIKNGYIHYNRAKTKRLYTIKIEPEAQSIINTLVGKNNLLNFSEQFQHHENFRKKVNKYLLEISKKINISKFTTYSARHSWGTYASEIDIPEKNIKMALGHGAKTTTDIYVNYNKKKIDDSNRKVINYVFKRTRKVKPFRKRKKAELIRKF